MSKEFGVVGAHMSCEIRVVCPRCDCIIDLLDHYDGFGFGLNDDGEISSQVFTEKYSWDDFEVGGVVCANCSKEFSVKSLEW